MTNSDDQYEDLVIAEEKGEIAALFFEHRNDIRKLYQDERWIRMHEGMVNVLTEEDEF